MFKEVRSLSGGERSRLELALLGIMPSNLLLLDEPTNHLDIPAREAIEAFMLESPATLLVVSHDRRLLETVCTTLWVVDDGLAVPFDGGYRAWRAAVADGWTVHEAAAERRAGGAAARRPRRRRPASAAGAAAGDRADRRRPGAAAGDRAAAAPARPRPRASCRRTPTAASRPSLDAELTPARAAQEPPRAGAGRPAVAANFVEMRRVTSELADVDAALAAAEDAWLELEERRRDRPVTPIRSGSG